MKRLALVALVLVAGCGGDAAPAPCERASDCRALLDQLLAHASPEQLDQLRGPVVVIERDAKAKRPKRTPKRAAARRPTPVVEVPEGGVFTPIPDPDLEIEDRQAPSPRARVPGRQPMRPSAPRPTPPPSSPPAPSGDLIDRLMRCVPSLACLPLP